MTAAKDLYKAYWNALDAPASRAGVALRPPFDRDYVRVGSASGGAFFALNATARKRELRVELVITGPACRTDLFSSLKRDGDALADEIGTDIVWEDRTPSRLRVSVRTTRDITNGAEWHEQQTWLVSTLRAFSRTLIPRLRSAGYDVTLS